MSQQPLRFGTSYFGNRILRHVETDMKQLVAQNFTYVVHTFNENDLLFYRDQMKKIVQVTKDQGLAVFMDPWGVGKVFGGESFSNYVCSNLDAVQILSDGKPGGMACPMHPRFRAFMVEWIEAALETGADGIFWDEPHFALPNWLGGRPNQFGCRCPVCQELFHQMFPHLDQMPTTMTDEMRAYLEWGIHDFLSYVIGEARKRGAHNILCMLPHDPGDWGPANFEKFAAIPGLDVFGTDPYFEWMKKDMEWVDRWTKRTVEAARANKLEPQIWHQSFKIPAGREPLQIKAVDIAIRHGVRDIAFWGFDACDHITWIRGDQPELMWQMIVEKFGALRAAER